MAEIIGLNPHNFKWAFTTGRFDLETEWKIKDYINAERLTDAYYALGVAREWLHMWQGSSLEELERKGYLPKTAQKTAKQILHRPLVIKWCRIKSQIC